MLNKVKMALRITTDAFNDELHNLISAALMDLGIGDINAELLNDASQDALIQQAVITYVKMHFGETDSYDRLRESYVEQKSQLITSSKYTTWRVDDNG